MTSLVVGWYLRLAAQGAAGLARADRRAAVRERRRADDRLAFAAVELQLAAEEIEPADLLGGGAYVEGVLRGPAS